ncbi:cation:proton antiporter [Clostridium formicaceticum]|uniref:Sodium/hydrogen exchanger family protein n=1 Tax=Clostridium formicaceticum TaxID=1497 RepID=A0AAC9RPA4_9CLOT|nr:cation:proton antiporter [Clostridium formicaceticum]AOY74912.1 hypothetical protein BJL90_02425 [Clostridium formicaceticum]ARE89319.1 Sodium/hydrogen exchanger family protein [Clostridium formicaceticum]
MNTSLYVGIILLIGLVGGKVASKINLPSVTGYILFGLLLGPSFTNIITKETIKSMQFVNEVALGILALSIGAELHRLVFKKFGKTLFLVSLGDELITFSLVTIFTYLLGLQLQLAIVLGVLAMTVSPSGVFSIVKEYGARGEFTKNLLALVAIDNLICIFVFGIVIAVLQGIESMHLGGTTLFILLTIEIALAIILGALGGVSVSYMMNKKPNNNKFLVFLLGLILLNIGIANHFNLSALLINMVKGATIVNLTNKKLILSSTLERIELPIFVLFLTLAGAKLDLSIVGSVGIVGLGYIGGRLLGKVGGSFIFSNFTSLNMRIRKNIGMALTPQAGVAIGLSIIAEQKLPASGGIITGILLTGVIFFEIVGPLLLKQALKNAGEI